MSVTQGSNTEPQYYQNSASHFLSQPTTSANSLHTTHRGSNDYTSKTHPIPGFSNTLNSHYSNPFRGTTSYQSDFFNFDIQINIHKTVLEKQINRMTVALQNTETLKIAKNFYDIFVKQYEAFDLKVPKLMTMCNSMCPLKQ